MKANQKLAKDGQPPSPLGPDSPDGAIERAIHALQCAGDPTSRIRQALAILGDHSQPANSCGRPGSSIVILKTNCAPVINEVFSNVDDVKVIVLDEDVEACDKADVCVVEGEEHWIGVFKPQHDVMRVADACVELITRGVKL